MNEQKTSAQLKTEYEAAKARLAELNALKAKLETDLKATDAEIRELVGFYRDGGKIKYLKRNWQTAQLREETEKLPKVRVKGKEQAVAIYWPVAPAERADQGVQDELKTWSAFLKAYRAQQWDQCDTLMINLQRMNAKKYLYEMYAERVASMRLLPFDPAWDGATNFETK
mgnify:CR=1 FL=1